MRLSRSFFERDTLNVARELLGNVLVCETPEGTISGVITETEAYLGELDDAAHSYKGKTERVRALYGEKGVVYIYLIYGKYYCLNFSTGPAGVPECVLIRALAPVSGVELMMKRRGQRDIAALCAGPGKLCMAMGLTKEHYGESLCRPDSRVYIEAGKAPERIEQTPRIGIDYAEKCREKPWRFVAKDAEKCRRACKNVPGMEK